MRTMMIDPNETVAERDVVERAARQVVRYQRYTAAVAKATRQARSRKLRRRRLDAYLRDHRMPRAPEWPAGVTEPGPNQGVTPEYESYLAAEEEWKEASRRWNEGKCEAQRDTRPEGSEERRKVGFEEDTGDDVIERFTRNDGKAWARLASRAIQLSKQRAFRITCGVPRTMSEIHGDGVT